MDIENVVVLLVVENIHESFPVEFRKPLLKDHMAQFVAEEGEVAVAGVVAAVVEDSTENRS